MSFKHKTVITGVRCLLSPTVVYSATTWLGLPHRFPFGHVPSVERRLRTTMVFRKQIKIILNSGKCPEHPTDHSSCYSLYVPGIYLRVVLVCLLGLRGVVEPKRCQRA